MQKLEFTNKTVFDFGTGKGILSILAEELGAASVTATDIDKWSIENAKENIQLNHCSSVSVYLSSTLPKQKFDIILANINKNVLLQFNEDFKKALNPYGYLVLSGLIQNDEKDIVQAFETEELKLVKQTTRSNWICLVFVNRR